MEPKTLVNTGIKLFKRTGFLSPFNLHLNKNLTPQADTGNGTRQNGAIRPQELCQYSYILNMWTEHRIVWLFKTVENVRLVESPNSDD